ncbi:MAG TPA: dTMP kinase [Candidatus Woesebacteria bacterium]|nr:dTMP kinase [Candidatus Woesebacteria bacterium]
MSEIGRFVVFDGIGGCGKGTQIKMLEQRLVQLGKKVFVTCEHTRNTPIGRLIEGIIKKQEDGVDPVALQLMFVADRANHTKRVIKPALDSYNFVLADRYEASTFAYAPQERREYFLNVNRGVTTRPDLTLIIDLDPEEAVRRVEARNDADIFDKVETLKNCRESYRWYFENSGWPCAWINGSGTKEKVAELIFNEIQTRGMVNG